MKYLTSLASNSKNLEAAFIAAGLSDITYSYDSDTVSIGQRDYPCFKNLNPLVSNNTLNQYHYSTNIDHTLMIKLLFPQFSSGECRQIGSLLDFQKKLFNLGSLKEKETDKNSIFILQNGVLHISSSILDFIIKNKSLIISWNNYDKKEKHYKKISFLSIYKLFLTYFKNDIESYVEKRIPVDKMDSKLFNMIANENTYAYLSRISKNNDLKDFKSSDLFQFLKDNLHKIRPIYKKKIPVEKGLLYIMDYHLSYLDIPLLDEQYEMQFSLHQDSIHEQKLFFRNFLENDACNYLLNICSLIQFNNKVLANEPYEPIITNIIHSDYFSKTVVQKTNLSPLSLQIGLSSINFKKTLEFTYFLSGRCYCFKSTSLKKIYKDFTEFTQNVLAYQLGRREVSNIDLQLLKMINI